jgi:sec-independent protein translocase protein TatB
MEDPAPLSKCTIYGIIGFCKSLREKEDTMFGIGMPELLVITALTLILIRQKKIPQIAKSLGKTLGELRKAADYLKETISEEIDSVKKEIPQRGELEQALKKSFWGGGRGKGVGSQQGFLRLSSAWRSGRPS